MRVVAAYVAIMALLVLLIFVARAQERRAARHTSLREPLSPAWIAILKKNLPPYMHLSPEERQRLHDYIKLFLADKNFEGCGGLELNDEIRLTIAAQACLLLVNRGGPCYPKLQTILVYPSAYVNRDRGLFQHGSHEVQVRLGESWARGVVVLSWDSVRAGIQDFRDGQNVALHEFAHQLDQEDGTADGTPILESSGAYATWSQVHGAEFNALLEKVDQGQASVMDAYGATNAAEFFAVVTETFFERPRQLRRKHPALYETLKSYYRLDPAEWDEYGPSASFGTVREH